MPKRGFVLFYDRDIGIETLVIDYFSSYNTIVLFYDRDIGIETSHHSEN